MTMDSNTATTYKTGGGSAISVLLIWIPSLLSPADVPTTVKVKVGAAINCGINLFSGAMAILYVTQFFPLFFKLDAMMPATQRMLSKIILQTGVQTMAKKALLEVSTPVFMLPL